MWGDLGDGFGGGLGVGGEGFGYDGVLGEGDGFFGAGCGLD